MPKLTNEQNDPENLQAIIRGVIDYTRDHPEMSREEILHVFVDVITAMKRLSDDELVKLTAR